MDKKLGGILVLFFLTFSIFVTVVFFNQPLTKLTRAKEDFLPSASNSLVFAYPLSLKADGKTPSAVNIFVRSAKGMPVKDQKVTVATTLGTVTELDATTNEQGKATFHLTSDTPGVAEVAVTVGTIELTQKLSVKFN